MKQLRQYKEASCILNVELTAKIALLEQETRHREDLAKTNTNLMMELATLHEQMEQAKTDAVAGFQTSQPYYDQCGGFYGDSFDDYLKQVAAVYPYLNLSQVVIDDIVPPTPSGANAAMDEADNSIHIVEEEMKEPTDVEAIDQHALEGQIIPDSPTTPKGSSAPEGPSALKDQPPSDVPLS